MESVEINGRRYPIVRVPSCNRNAVARLRDGKIVVSLPRRWPEAEMERVCTNLLKRAVRAIAKGRWSPERATKVGFSNGQMVTALGRELSVVFVPGRRFGARVRDGKLEVRVDESHPAKAGKAATAARRAITKEVMPELLARVGRINDAHFRAPIRRVSLRDSISRWGSCAPDGSISLNFRLLFMPETILDYVIVHELAHTKYKSHGQRFWQLVERVMPDHKERRKWLKENGWSYPQPASGSRQPGSGSGPDVPDSGNRKPGTGNPGPAVPGQQRLAEYYDEPY